MLLFSPCSENAAEPLEVCGGVQVEAQALSLDLVDGHASLSGSQDVTGVASFTELGDNAARRGEIQRARAAVVGRCYGDAGALG
jgi:hypothetical protein